MSLGTWCTHGGVFYVSLQEIISIKITPVLHQIKHHLPAEGDRNDRRIWELVFWSFRGQEKNSSLIILQVVFPSFPAPGFWRAPGCSPIGGALGMVATFQKSSPWNHQQMHHSIHRRIPIKGKTLEMEVLMGTSSMKNEVLIFLNDLDISKFSSAMFDYRRVCT